MNTYTMQIDDSGWEVPAHEVAQYAPKSHRHALVIPVINEGDRIRGQLLRTKAANLPVDVIVADGGSSDGSLDPAFVGDAGVRAVLTKTGPGKLSAQLRMAYAWCLRQGYEGIVTIDGNGKDGVEAVAEFVARLEEGCDYVQGSRYLPGGAAENTPLERTVANRLVHAPLLSIAGRHWFTDTTNGFRAYSARYLLHPQVQPFREQFGVYSLLFYLTVRAGQLGLNVDHVPVARRYPDSGKVPTKIGGLSSKLALLGETVSAATGGYTPDAVARKMPSFLWSLLIALAFVLPMFLGVVENPPYTPDSWALFELSQTVFGDFYRFTHFRSYASDIPYSAAFPPLYPALIAVVDGLLGTGARTGLYLAFLFFLAFAVLSEAIGRRVTGAAWVGLAAALALLLGPKMLVAELEAGRTMPLQLCLYAVVLLGLLKGREISLSRAVGIGLVAGLAVLNRFDAILLPVFAAAAIGWFTRKPVNAVAALVAAVVTVSPWIYYSLTTFGTHFATDNSGVVATLDPRAFVTDWWPEPQPTWADDPAAWFSRVMGNVFAFGRSGAGLVFSPMGFAMVVSVGVLAALQWLIAKGPGAGGDAVRSDAKLRVLAIFAAVTALMMGPQFLTGYVEYRYFTALFWTLFLLTGCWLIARGATLSQRRVFARMFLLTIVAVSLPFHVLRTVSEPGETANRSDFANDPRIEQLQSCLAADPDARILVLGDDAFAAKAGATTGIATMMEPRNIVDGRLDADGARAFLEVWEVDYLLSMRPDGSASTFGIDKAERVENCPLMLFDLPVG